MTTQALHAVSAPESVDASGVGPLQPQDLPDLVQLFDVSFFRGPGRRLPQLEACLHDLFIPVSARPDGGLRSFVYRDERGRLGGFLGTHPRRFVFEGQPILAACCGQLMVRPDLRGQGIASRLCAAFYAGPQQFSFHGTAARTREIHRRMGAFNPPFYGLSWTYRFGSLAPAFRRFVKPLGDRLWPGRNPPAECALDPPAVAVAALRDAEARVSIPRSQVNGNLGDVASIHRRAFEDARFYPAFTEPEFYGRLALALGVGSGSDNNVARFAIGRADVMTHARVVYERGEPIGFFLWRLQGDGTGLVLDLLCVPGTHGQVLRVLLTDARRCGASTIGGYCADCAEACAVQAVGASLRYRPSTYMVHSPCSEITAVFLDAPPRLSTFDGEGWLDFPRC